MLGLRLVGVVALLAVVVPSITASESSINKRTSVQQLAPGQSCAK
jgi:hypothetical protein